MNELKYLYYTCKMAYIVSKSKNVSRRTKINRLLVLGFSKQEAILIIPFDPERDFN